MKHMQTLYQRWTPTQIGRHWEEEAEAVVNMLADLSSQSEAETHGDTLGDAEAEPLVGRYLKPYNRRRPRQTVTHCAMWRLTHRSIHELKIYQRGGPRQMSKVWAM